MLVSRAAAAAQGRRRVMITAILQARTYLRQSSGQLQCRHHDAAQHDAARWDHRTAHAYRQQGDRYHAEMHREFIKARRLRFLMPFSLGAVVGRASPPHNTPGAGPHFRPPSADTEMVTRNEKACAADEHILRRRHRRFDRLLLTRRYAGAWPVRATPEAIFRLSRVALGRAAGLAAADTFDERPRDAAALAAAAVASGERQACWEKSPILLAPFSMP